MRFNLKFPLQTESDVEEAVEQFVLEIHKEVLDYSVLRSIGNRSTIRRNLNSFNDKTD